MTASSQTNVETASITSEIFRFADERGDIETGMPVNRAKGNRNAQLAGCEITSQ